MRKIVFITTVNHNVGDDFVREGLKYLFRKRFPNEGIEFENIHKHSPITCRYGCEWFRNYRLSSRIDYLMPLALTQDRILEADVVVQSGAPVYWCHDTINSHCSKNEWYLPLIKRRLLKNKKATFLNLAAGSCQGYHSDGTEFLRCNDDMKYIKELFALSKLTSVRDALAKKVLNLLGLDAPLIPCSSLFAIDEHMLRKGNDDYIVVNYMEGGSHYTFDQQIDKPKWKREFTEFYKKIRKRQKVIFSCHSMNELHWAKEIDSDATIFYSSNFLEYMKFYSRAKFGIMNRIHGAFLMASFGKPSVVIGNDTRAKMVSEIGLKSYFVNDINTKNLLDFYENLEAIAEDYGGRLSTIKKKAYDDYLQIFSEL